MNLNLLILCFSIIGALFSFLIWRESSTRDLYSQEQIIREEYQDEEIPINFWTNESHLTLVASVDLIKCTEPDSDWLYRLKRAIFGSNGRTVLQFSLYWSRVPEEIPELSALSLKQSISELDHSDSFNGEISPSGFGKQSIKIFATHPKEVYKELRAFLELVEEAVEREVEEHQAMQEAGPKDA